VLKPDYYQLNPSYLSSGGILSEGFSYTWEVLLKSLDMPQKYLVEDIRAIA
jgi:hypothetical protein